MNLTKLHRRLPLIRRPFDVLATALTEIAALKAQLAATESAQAALDAALGENAALTAALADSARKNQASRAQVQPSTDRTKDLKRVYVAHVERLKASAPLDEAMRNAVGGLFDHVGSIEVAICRHYGLKPDGCLIDVGCGSGRLAHPLSRYLQGRYAGFDVVDELVAYARETVNRPDWRFAAIDHIGIPEQDGSADMVCFFSVLTHLLHEQSFWYLEEARRVLKPGGKIVCSFLEFGEAGHWPIFLSTLGHAKEAQTVDPLNVFIERNALHVWAEHLGLAVEEIRGAGDVIVPEGALGQSLCVLRQPA